MPDTRQPPTSRGRQLLSLLAGVLCAVIIVFVMQQLAGKGKDDLTTYEGILQASHVKQARLEFFGLLAGIYIGALITTLLSSGRSPGRTLAVPLFVICIIIISPWKFVVQKETIILALPLWMIAGLAGFYSSRLLKRRND